MKRKVIVLSALIFSIAGAYAQGEMDAYKMSQRDLTGTARSVSMGGAFGALGGDISGVAINPAGIGVYRTSEIVTTLNFQNTKTETKSNTGKFDDSKFKFNFDNLAFVTVFPVQSDVAPLINFGFSYNRLKNFDRKYSMKGTSSKSLMANYMSHRAHQTGPSNPDKELKFQNDKDTYPLDEYDWLAVFGYNSGMTLYDKVGDKDRYYLNSAMAGLDANHALSVREKGSIDSYDFNMGTTFSNIVSVGLTLSLTDIKYNLYSAFGEDYIGTGSGFTLENELRTEGTGFQVGVGVIVKPMNELRIGLAYHSPTWYNMTDFYRADFDYNLSGLGSNLNKGRVNTDTYQFDYRLRTPDRWTFSLAGVIGQMAILSADYELTNYGNMKLHNDNGDELDGGAPNEFIKSDFRMASTLRLGAEIRITPQFSGRVGYSWRQSPLKKEFKENKNEAMTIGSVSHYILDGDTNYFTYGLGYRFTKNFYGDIAFVMRTQKSDLYNFATFADGGSSVSAPKTEWKDNTFQGLFTLGYRF